MDDKYIYIYIYIFVIYIGYSAISSVTRKMHDIYTFVPIHIHIDILHCICPSIH